MKPPSGNRQLHQLARLYGVQTAYYDVTHQRQQASTESLLAVLRALGAPVSTLRDVPLALRERQQALWQRPLEPVMVAWDRGPFQIEVRLPTYLADGPLVGHLMLESGESQCWQWRGVELPVLQTANREGVPYVVKGLHLSGAIPWGYHRFTLEIPGKSIPAVFGQENPTLTPRHKGELGGFESLIISAPVKAYSPPAGEGRTWGVFLPLYALRTENSWGSGSFSDLEALAAWIGGMGGGILGTLPLLAAFLEDPFDPSPYAPASRLFWNEFYLDATRAPEFGDCPGARALLASAYFQGELAGLRRLSQVDYRRGMALKRRVLEELSACCFAQAPRGSPQLGRFLEAHPVVADYARFRATGERQRVTWESWPGRLREGSLSEGDYDEPAWRYHVYVQWLAQQQVQALAAKAREEGVGLYLDLPLGAHPGGYDVWRSQRLFVREAAAGAPPDAFFTQGQNWGFPPMQPERLRQDGYRYFIAYLRHHLQYAVSLRIDHVMGLHRLFWIPRGMAASQGVYLRYPAEEFYAILALESHRNQTILVGEDLGTVPPEVRPAMHRHGLYCMYVAYYELTSEGRLALKPAPANALASINTHDMPPFAAFWQGLDIRDWQELGLRSEAEAHQESLARKTLKKNLVRFLRSNVSALGRSSDTGDASAILRAILAFLSASRAWAVLVNLEDLWLETEPQNVPGTSQARPNWRRKARYSLEEFSRLPQVVDLLGLVNRIRRQRGRLP